MVLTVKRIAAQDALEGVEAAVVLAVDHNAALHVITLAMEHAAVAAVVVAVVAVEINVVPVLVHVLVSVQEAVNVHVFQDV